MDFTNMFYISDTHFGHEGIIQWERTEFKTIQEHDNYIKQKLYDWAYHHPKRTLWHMGDFGDAKEVEFFKMLREQFGCTFGIVKGNHDTGRNWKTVKEGFDYVSDYPLYIANRVMLSHEPVYPLPEGVVNICGHLHSATLDSEQHKVVSAKLINYQPIGGKTIQKLLSRIPAPSEKFLYEPYAHLYKFTQEKSDVVYDKDGLIKLEKSRKLFSKLYS